MQDEFNNQPRTKERIKRFVKRNSFAATVGGALIVIFGPLTYYGVRDMQDQLIENQDYSSYIHSSSGLLETPEQTRYTRFTDGSEEIAVTHGASEKLYINLDGDNLIDRIRIKSCAREFCNDPSTLIRVLNSSQHPTEFTEGDALLIKERKCYFTHNCH